MINNYLKNITKIKKYNEKKETLNKNNIKILNILEYYKYINKYEYLILKEFETDYNIYLYHKNITNKKLKSYETYNKIDKILNKILILIDNKETLKENELLIKLYGKYIIKYKNNKNLEKLLKELIMTILNINKTELDKYNYY